MQVNGFLKELRDENKLRVEKIGSVNWDWYWAGEEVRKRKNVVAQLEWVVRLRLFLHPSALTLTHPSKPGV